MTKALFVALALFAPVAAVSPGLMRREPEGNVAMIEKPKSKMGGSCDEKNDGNCCLTEKAIAQIHQKYKWKLSVGQCAAGAMYLAGEKEWETLWKKLEFCKTDVCEAQNVPTGKGTCAAYTCPKGWKAKKNDVAKAPCPSAVECNFNCCNVDINADTVRKNGVLTYAALWAVTNVTRFSNGIGFPVRHTHVDFDDDLMKLNDSIVGLYNVMNTINPDYKKYCPSQKKEDDFSHLNSIKTCVDMALCEMAQSSRTKEDTKIITMLREYYSKFEDVTWDYLWTQLRAEENLESWGVINGSYVEKPVAVGNATKLTFGEMKVDFMEAAELECLGMDGFLEDMGKHQLLETGRAAAYQASKALIDAARATHALMHHHQDSDNSSMDATIAALHRAWEPACKLLNCDHTNYWSLLGASHSHSIALIESGASANHMSVHVRTRTRLDRHVQMFLASSESKHTSKIYRTEGTRTEAQTAKYGAYMKTSLARVMTEHPKTYGLDHTLLGLYERNEVQKFAKTSLQAHLLEGFQNNNIYIVQGVQQLNEIREIAYYRDLQAEAELSEAEEARLAELLHKSLIFKDIGNFFEDGWEAAKKVATVVGNVVVAAVEASIDFVEEAGKKIHNAATDFSNTVAEIAVDTVKGIAKTATVVADGVAKAGDTVNGWVVKTGDFFTALGEAVVTVFNIVGTALECFIDFILSNLLCIGAGVVSAVGYGKKYPNPPPAMWQAINKLCNVNMRPVLCCAAPPNPATIGIALTIAMTSGASLTDYFQGIAVFAFGIGISIVVGAVPGGVGTGGLRIGLGIALSTYCSVNLSQSSGSCMFDLMVGAVVSAVLPLSGGSPRCVLGWCANFPVIGDTACAEGFGVTVKLLCCQADIIRGCTSCHPTNPCPETETSSTFYSKRQEIDTALTAGDSCDETIIGRGFNYRGCQTRTKGGLECQKWSSQYPHKWNPAVNWWKNGQGGLGDHNMCRNPNNGATGIWCLTKSPSKKWAKCNEFDAGHQYVSKTVMTTWQTSTGWGGESSRALDGNTSPIYGNGGCTHTGWQWDPYWLGDLKSDQGLERIKVYNRGDGWGHRLNGYRVDIIADGYRQTYTTDNIPIADGASKMTAFGKIGRYVVVRLPRTAYLSLCEVKVTLMYTFLGLSMSRTQQSSSGWSGVPSRAVDGGAATNYGSGSCTHTHYNWLPWWQVDMQGLADIVKIKVTNRGDCCGSRLNGFKIDIDGVNCAQNQQIGQGQAVESECNMDGHIVKVTVPRNDWLTLCEVQVATKTATLRPPMVALVFVVGTWVSIKSLSGKYCSDYAINVGCNQNELGDGDRFKVAKGWGGNTRIALKGGTWDRWCSDEGNRVRCDLTAVGPYEMFEPARGWTGVFDGNGVALKAFGIGKGYCADWRTPACDSWRCVSALTAPFRCTSNASPGPWQTFEVTNVGCAGISTAHC